MSIAAITLEVLPAACGDCLLIQCPVGKRSWRMLVDTGPDDTYPALKARLAALPVDAQGQRRIDIFVVVTHIDHDHIGDAELLLSDKSLNLNIGNIWFNAPPRHLERGVAEGESLAELLDAARSPCPWNVAFSGNAAATSGDGGFLELQAARGAPRITLLSPSPDRLTDLFKVWDLELARLRQEEADKPSVPESLTRDPRRSTSVLWRGRSHPRTSRFPMGRPSPFCWNIRALRSGWALTPSRPGCALRWPAWRNTENLQDHSAPMSSS